MPMHPRQALQQAFASPTSGMGMGDAEMTAKKDEVKLSPG